MRILQTVGEDAVVTLHVQMFLLGSNHYVWNSGFNKEIEDYVAAYMSRTKGGKKL
jgi:hypothetical protein